MVFRSELPKASPLIGTEHQNVHLDQQEAVKCFGGLADDSLFFVEELLKTIGTPSAHETLLSLAELHPVLTGR